MSRPAIRVLVVDDHDFWRRFSSTMLQKQPELYLVDVASDGLQAVQVAQRLQPDLILLDIGLPKLNGIEAARQIRELSPDSKILFVSENRSPDVAAGALSAGGGGYVIKSDAGRDLLRAVHAVLRDEQFVSASLADARNVRNGHRHEVEFYADDAAFMDGYARFLGEALKIGDPAVVIASRTHRAGIEERLLSDGVNLSAAIEKDRYIPLDVAATLSILMANGMPSPVLCATAISDLMARVANSTQGKHSRIALCGELAPTLLAAGKAEAAIALERLWDKMAAGHGVQTLCGYSASAFADGGSGPIFQRICAEHSAVHGRELFC